jgi:hypothetical protein
MRKRGKQKRVLQESPVPVALSLHLFKFWTRGRAELSIIAKRRQD